MSEQELKVLKEQIKQELLAEINTNKEKTKTVWQSIKEEFKEDFKMFNYTKDTKVIGTDYKPYMREDEVHFEYIFSTTIGTILRLMYQTKNVNKIDADYEEVKGIVQKIINILKENKKVVKI